MNEVCVMGRIITNIEYKFIINKRADSIAKFKLQLFNNSIVSVKAYNSVADKILRRFKYDCTVCIYGKLNTKMELIVKEIIKQ